MVYVEEHLPKNEHDIQKRLKENLAGGFTVKDKSHIGTQLGKWHSDTYQRKVLRPGLEGLYLLAKTSVDFDGTVEGFVRIYLKSEFGDPLIRAYVGWRTVVSKTLNDVLRAQGRGSFACPLFANVISERRSKKTDQLVFGNEPLKVNIEVLWMRRMFEWRQHPARGTIPSVACAHYTMFVFKWAVINIFGHRVHGIEKMGIVTRQQFESLAPNAGWNGAELQHGVWFYYDKNMIRVHINDSKKVKTSVKGKRDVQSHLDNVYDKTIMANGVYQPGTHWLQVMWPYVLESVHVLAPKDRYYTSNIWDTQRREFKDVPMLYIPTPRTPVASLQLLQIDQSKIRKPDGSPYEDLTELYNAALEQTGVRNRRSASQDPAVLTDLAKRGLTICRFPNRADHTSLTSNEAGVSSQSNCFYNKQFLAMMQQIDKNTFEMGKVGIGKNASTWNLDKHFMVAKNKRKAGWKNDTYEFTQPFNLSELVGYQKLFGGQFDKFDIQSVEVQAAATRNGDLIYDLQSSRHSTSAEHIFAQTMVQNFVGGGVRTKRQQKSQRVLTALEQVFQTHASRILEREVHDAVDTVDVSYCDMMKRFDVCKPKKLLELALLLDGTQTYLLKKIIWSHPVMKDPQNNYRQNAVDIGGTGINFWPKTLAPCYATSAHQGQSITERCHDFQLLTPHEQIQCLWTLSATRTFLSILHEEYHACSKGAEYGKLWEFVTEITTPPKQAARTSSRHMDIGSL